MPSSGDSLQASRPPLRFSSPLSPVTPFMGEALLSAPLLEAPLSVEGDWTWDAETLCELTTPEELEELELEGGVEAVESLRAG